MKAWSRLGVVAVYVSMLLVFVGCEDDGGGGQSAAAPSIVPAAGAWAGTEISFVVNGDSTAVTELHYVFHATGFDMTSDITGTIAIIDGAFSFTDRNPNGTQNIFTVTFTDSTHATGIYRYLAGQPQEESQTYTAVHQ